MANYEGERSVRRARTAALGLWLAVAVAFAGLHIAPQMRARYETTAGIPLASAGQRAPAKAERARPKRSQRSPERRRERDGAQKHRRRARWVHPKRAERGHAPPVAPRFAGTYRLKRRHHDYPAIDIAMPRNRNAYSVTAGRVARVTKKGACGRGVILRGKDGFTYTYCHGSDVLVRKGRKVKPGTLLLKTGNTGNSSGPHLHLQMSNPRGRLVCPQDVLLAWAKGKGRAPWKADRKGCSR